MQNIDERFEQVREFMAFMSRADDVYRPAFIKHRLIPSHSVSYEGVDTESYHGDSIMFKYDHWDRCGDTEHYSVSVPIWVLEELSEEDHKQISPEAEERFRAWITNKEFQQNAAKDAAKTEEARRAALATEERERREFERLKSKYSNSP